MFKKLKNRFLLLNLITITVMMFAAFATIYAITYQDVKRDIDMELHQISDFYRKTQNHDGPRRFEPDGGGGPPGEYQGGLPADMDGNGWRPEMSVSFMLETDSSGSLTRTDSLFDMEENFYQEALEKALASGRTSGQLTLDGNEWAFIVQSAGAGSMFIFMDVTAEQGILTNLIYTFSAVALAMLLVIYLISRYFASRYIAPVKEAFEKQKQFIADASHELKTPLAVIQTNADVLLGSREDTIANQAKWLNVIKQETHRMAKLTGDLLYLTEMEDSRSAMMYAEFDLSEAVETIILTMEAVIFEKELHLDYDIEPGS